jgi:hypothetical protein
MFEKINQLLRRCKNWGIENKACRLKFERGHIVNVKDLPFNCRGYSNPQLCAWYKYERLTDDQIRRMRIKLRENRP